MYVLTGVRELETSPSSCVDRLAREPSHKTSTCVVGLASRGEKWQCGEFGSRRQEEEQEPELRMEVVEDDGETVLLPKNYQVMGQSVWTERVLMSPFNARPLLIAQVKESRETLATFFRSYFDPEVHSLTHYTSGPAWEAGRQYYLWSPRGRCVVREEECTVTTVQSKTLVKNPLRVKFEPKLEVEEVGKEEGEGSSRKRKLYSPTSPSLIPRSEAQQRLAAYKWMVARGRTEGLRVEENYSCSLSCEAAVCNHIKGSDGTCSELQPSSTKLESALKLFDTLLLDRTVEK